MLPTLAACALACCSSSPAAADAARADSSKPSSTSWIGVPVVYYTPETDLCFGLTGAAAFRIDTSASTLTSQVTLALIRSVRAHTIAELAPRLFMDSGNVAVEGSLLYTMFPNLYYGIGPNTSAEAEEPFTSEVGRIRMQGLYRAVGNLYAGLRYHVEWWAIHAIRPDGELASGGIYGTDRGVISGLGAVVRYDTRDNAFAPYSGHFLEASFVPYIPALGSTSRFNRAQVDARAYTPVASSFTLATRALMMSTDGDVPLEYIPRQGGEAFRGYYEGRWRDKTVVSVAAEARIPLLWRFGMVAFAGLGTSAASPEQLSVAYLRSSFGLGLRFAVFPQERLNLRIDIARGNLGDIGFYLNFGEVF